MKSKKNYFLFGLILVILAGASFSFNTIYAETTHLRLATTTSTENSGLLEVLLLPFEVKFGVRVDVIVVGTGKALKLGENGDVDVVLVHARAVEDKFIQEGYGVNRRDVMYNDFIILGPFDDPAKIKDEKNVVLALRKISEQKIYFVSRGDDSGTHKKEKSLWQKTGINPQGKWYMEVGQGMGAALQIAYEKQAYILCDRGTFLAYKDKIDLIILFEGDSLLFNPYGIMAVNPALYPQVKYIEAMQLIAWITSVEGQKIIKEYKKEGEVLFHPMAIR